MDTKLGYDYATRPTIVVVGDMEFPRCFSEDFLALGYSQLPHFGVLVNPPLLAFIFASVSAAQEAFAHLKSWVDASGDGDAVGLGFVEAKDGGYRLCVYQEPDRQLKRCIPEHLRDEVEPQLITATAVKAFPHRSDYYDWFKAAASHQAFVVDAGTSEGPVSNLAFRKREVRFYSEDDVPLDAQEMAAVESSPRVRKALARGRAAHQERLNPLQLAARRRAQLIRFFPVTMEFLSLSGRATDMLDSMGGSDYRGWQVFQAVCNLALRQRVPELFQSPEPSAETGAAGEMKVRVLEHLLGHFEDVTEQIDLGQLSNVDEIAAQITADSLDLLHYVDPEQDFGPDETQAELARRQLLED